MDREAELPAPTGVGSGDLLGGMALKIYETEVVQMRGGDKWWP